MIISAITFRTDPDKKNAYIFWLGTKIDVPQEYYDQFTTHFGASYRKLGLSSFLMVVVIKHCAAVNDKEINLYLQMSVDSQKSLLFYQKKNF